MYREGEKKWCQIVVTTIYEIKKHRSRCSYLGNWLQCMYIQNPELQIGEHNARNGGAVCCVYFSEVCADQREVADRGEVVLCVLCLR